MAVNVSFYRMDKLQNSTATPVTQNLQPLVETEVVFKETTSVANPTLILNCPLDSPLPGYSNYLRIGGFDRYYFIRDWVSVRQSLWEVICEIDVCGTYRDEILASTQFVERAEKAFNNRISDGLCVGLSSYGTMSMEYACPWNIFGGDNPQPDYLVEILGQGASVYYEFSTNEFRTFFVKLFDDDYASSILPMWEDLAPDFKANLNPLQYIGSIRSFDTMPPGYATDRIYVGWGYVDMNGHTFNATKDTWDVIVNWPHSQQWETYAFADYYPYAEYGLYLPLFGDMPIDPAAARGGVAIHCELSYITGNAELVAEDVFGRVVGTATANLSRTVSISNTYAPEFGIANAVDGAVGFVGSLLTGNFQGAYQALKGTFNDAVGTVTPKMRSTGANTALLTPEDKIRAYGKFQAIKGPASHFVGRPYYEAVELSTLLGGYCQCYNAEMHNVGTADEARKLESIMEGGFYLE